MSGRLPKRFWRVSVRSGEKLPPRVFRAGQTYTREDEARKRLESLRRMGVQCDLYESEPVIWTLVDGKAPTIDGEQQLW